MPVPTLSPDQWTALRKRLIFHALRKLVKSKPKALELVDAAIAKALEPATRPWDPDAGRSFDDYLADLVWSIHGNEAQSYRVVMASHRLEVPEAADAAAPSSRDPERLLLAAPKKKQARRQYAALLTRIAGDPLIVLLLRAGHEGARDEGASDARPGYEPSAEQIEQANAAFEAEPAEKRPNAEAESTRRALAQGYSHADIKNARLRLGRHIAAVVREDVAAYPHEEREEA